jgi:hypothetical protein
MLQTSLGAQLSLATYLGTMDARNNCKPKEVRGLLEWCPRVPVADTQEELSIYGVLICYSQNEVTRAADCCTTWYLYIRNKLK